MSVIKKILNRTIFYRSLKLPKIIQFPVNNICNSRCVMCNIWQFHEENDISATDINEIFSDSLFKEVESVGINGGEPTLRDDLDEIVYSLIESLPNLKNISIITNGYETDNVLKKINSIGKITKQHSIRFEVMLSIDGVGEIHDSIRRREDFFRNVNRTLDGLISINNISKLRIGCTVIKHNVYHLRDLFDYANEKNVYIKYRLGIPHQRLASDNEKLTFDLNNNEKHHIVEFFNYLIGSYESSSGQINTYKSIINQLVGSGKRLTKCYWQSEACTISSTGELSYCAVQSKVLLKAKEGSYRKAYFQHKNYLKNEILPKCVYCSHDYSGPELLKDKIIRSIRNKKNYIINNHEIIHKLYMKFKVLLEK